MPTNCKFYKQKKQYSTDGGVTWYDVFPPEYQKGELYEYQSEDCIDHSKEYLTFVPVSGDTTFGWSTNRGVNSGNTVYYSLDSGLTWNSMSSGDSVTVNEGDEIYWKASGLTPSPSYGDYGIGEFYSIGNFNVKGNIMSLVYGDNFVGQTDLSGKDKEFYMLFYGCTEMISAEYLVLPATTLSDDCYAMMFYDSTSLTTAPELPATTLANSCYSNMFHGCTSLTTAPSLPATALTSGCYQAMFLGCTSLTTAPELPATTLAQTCYGLMFSGCTSLTTAPELPATTLAEFCYDWMFGGCTSLTTAPALPATTLSNACYQQMFYGCTSLTASPVLPAPTLVDSCYRNMFHGCTSLSSITCLATDISAVACLTAWAVDVASSGTFTKAASMENWPSGHSGIPNGWTVVNA